MHTSVFVILSFDLNDLVLSVHIIITLIHSRCLQPYCHTGLIMLALFELLLYLHSVMQVDVRRVDIMGWRNCKKWVHYNSEVIREVVKLSSYKFTTVCIIRTFLGAHAFLLLDNFRFLDTSLCDVDVQPTYVRVYIKGKVSICQYSIFIFLVLQLSWLVVFIVR